MGRSRYEFVSWGNYIFLTSVRLWARFCAHFFFRRYRITGSEKIPTDVPLIYCANHQSAFLDPVLLGISCRRKPWYITRAGVFTTPVVKFLLNSLHMLPIFRPRDNVDIKSANVDTFAACNDILKGRGSVLIFAEGNHDMRKRLRVPLKKGFARIALEASKPEYPVWIVPVGLTYEDPIQPRSDVLIQYGTPFSVAPFLDNQARNEAITSLTRTLEESMRPFVLDISSAESYDDVEREWQESRNPVDSLTERFVDDQAAIDSIMAGEKLPPRAAQKSGFGKLIKRVLSLPVVVAGVVLNLPLILLTRWVIASVVRDPHFDQSVKFVCGLAGIPLFGLFFFLGMWWVTGEPWPSLITTLLGPILGIWAYDLLRGLWWGSEYVPSSKRMQFRK